MPRFKNVGRCVRLTKELTHIKIECDVAIDSLRQFRPKRIAPNLRLIEKALAECQTMITACIREKAVVDKDPS